jgi:glycosyl transferase family 25
MYPAKIVYINLDRREDRRIHMNSLLEKYGMQADRFAAIEHPYGLYGCGLSHLAVLKMARVQGWDNVLILEDDITFKCKPNELNGYFAQIFAESGWDVFMLDMNLRESWQDSLSKNTNLFRIKFAHCAGAYIVKSHYYDKLIELYEDALPKLERTQMHWVYANDAVWTRLQEVDQWWGFRRQICIQMGGYSDTKNMITGEGGTI